MTHLNLRRGPNARNSQSIIASPQITNKIICGHFSVSIITIRELLSGQGIPDVLLLINEGQTQYYVVHSII